MMKFIAANADAAKAKARRALGDHAVIISIRNLPSGDVEVTAADKPVSGDAPASPALTGSAGFAFDARQAVEEERSHGGGARLNEAIETKFTENAFDRVKTDLAGGNKTDAHHYEMAQHTASALSELLEGHGVSKEFLHAMLGAASLVRMDDDYHRLETAFAQTFTFAPFDFSAGGRVMLVGPTGAGKTSSSAKLAQASMEHGLRALMMTADVGRAGAIEQIKTYGDSLGADYFIVETPMDVAQVLHSNAADGLAILDTPGVSPFDSGDIAALQSFREAAQAEPVLVLPASGDMVEFSEWAKAFAQIGVRRAIITKFDATKRVGAGLSAVHSAGLAIAHLSETAFISEGILDARPDYLAQRFLMGQPGRILK